MVYLQSLVLGAVQGMTEFVPISSSGHLRLIQDGLGWQDFGLAYDTMLHVATLLAVVVYFRADLAKMARAFFSSDPSLAHDRRLAWLVIVATIPTGLIGLAGSDFFESASLRAVGIALICTAAILITAERLSRKRIHDPGSLRIWQAVAVGVAQGVAVMPGISRAGATIAGGLGVGLDRVQAARFSFLLSGPIILLAGAKQALDVIGGDSAMPSFGVSAVGFIAAAIAGYLAIAGMISFLRSRPLYVFAVYTAFAGTSVVVWQTVG